LNNPLCVLPALARKELQPGLYALFGMLNDYNRDAFLASAADADVKAGVKALWRESMKILSVHLVSTSNIYILVTVDLDLWLNKASLSLLLCYSCDELGEVVDCCLCGLDV